MGQGPRSEPLPGGSREDMAFFGWTAWTSDLHKGSLSPLSPPAEHQRVASISFGSCFWSSTTERAPITCLHQRKTHLRVIRPVNENLSCGHIGCESWTLKKAERQRIDAFELWCQIRLLRVLWTAGTLNQSILKEINPAYSLEGLMLKLKL